MFRLYIRHTRTHRYMWWISTTRSPKKPIEIDHRVQREKTIADDEPLRRTKQMRTSVLTLSFRSLKTTMTIFIVSIFNWNHFICSCGTFHVCAFFLFSIFEKQMKRTEQQPKKKVCSVGDHIYIEYMRCVCCKVSHIVTIM